MKPGHIIRLSERVAETLRGVDRFWVYDGKSSDETYARGDAVKSVEQAGGPERVLIVKVIAVVCRSARVEE